MSPRHDDHDDQHAVELWGELAPAAEEAAQDEAAEEAEAAERPRTSTQPTAWVDSPYADSHGRWSTQSSWMAVRTPGSLGPHVYHIFVGPVGIDPPPNLPTVLHFRATLPHRNAPASRGKVSWPFCLGVVVGWRGGGPVILSKHPHPVKLPPS